MKKILSESVFNPDISCALSFAMSLNDPRYYENKAIELIRESQQSINLTKTLGGEDYDKCVQRHEDYHEKMKQAISLLAMARAYESYTEENK